MNPSMGLASGRQFFFGRLGNRSERFNCSRRRFRALHTSWCCLSRLTPAAIFK